MIDLDILLSEIELKLRKLMSYKNRVVNENSELIQKNEELQRRVDALVLENAELKEKINKLVIVNAFGNEKEIEEGRKLIKSLVKEIDQSIAILSTEQ